MPTKSIFVIGASLIILGLVMIPLPGPGALIICLGLLVTVVGGVSVTVSSAGRSGSRQ